MKKFLYVLLGIIVLLVLVVVVGPGLIDWRPRVAAAVREATGRDLRIDGDLSISLVPKVKITVNGVHFANAPGAAEPDMLSLESLALEAELLPLLGKRLVIDRLAVKRPVVNLDVDKSGRPNWQFASSSGTATAPPASPSSGSDTLGGLSLGDIAVENGEVTYRDAATGQTIAVKSIELNAAMAALESPLTLKGQMIVNAEPVTANLAVDNPGKLRGGQQATVKLALDTKHLQAKFDGSAQQQPLPGLTGIFDLDTPSVGKLLAWLQQPLSPGAADPGPLKVHAEFAAEGAKTALKTATIAGAGLNAKASGAVDESGGRTRVSLDIESDALDIDRLLPPQQHGSAPTGPPAPSPVAPPKNPLAVIPDEPFDLAPLRRTDADIKVSIAGLKVKGLEVGRIAFTGSAKGGVLTSNLAELDLYGGTIKGMSKLDASGDVLAFNSAINVDHVAVEKLAQLAGTSTVSGVVSASLETGGQGKSPRAVAQSFHGRLALDLGGIKDAATRGLSGLKVAVDLPGPGKATTVKLDGVYNAEPLAVAATLAPMDELLSRDRFAAKLAVDSKLITLHYDGAVQRAPVAGLDGTFDVDIPALARLAAWVGEPLDPKAPDPGALKLHAVLASDGAKLALKDASLTGKAIKATADAKVDASSTPLSFDAKLAVQQADLNAYLPPPAPASTAPAPAAGAPTGWSTDPFPLGPLGEANGQATLDLAGVRYRDLDVAKGGIALTLKNRVLKVTVEKLALAQGTIDAGATLDGSSGALKLDYKATLAGVQVQPLLKTFAGSDRLSGTIAFDTTGNGNGKNEKELIQTLDGSGHFKVTDGAIHGINLAQQLRNAGSLGFGASNSEKTDFAELDGSFTIKSGVLDNKDMKMLAPIFRLSGSGTVPLPPKTIDYEVEAKLVASLQGQGGNEGLNGVPIPIKVTGPWSSLSYNVDWNGVFKSLASDPERLKSLSGNLGKAAKSLGVDVPGGLLKGVPGGEAPSGGTQQQQQPQQQQKKPSPDQLLKGLLGK